MNVYEILAAQIHPLMSTFFIFPALINTLDVIIL